MIKFKALCIVFMFLLSCSVNAEEQVIVVKKGDAASLLEAIDQANKQNADPLSERIYILIPDGLYDLKTTVLTSITGYNISLVGQSMYFTVIRNAPSIEMAAAFLLEEQFTMVQFSTNAFELKNRIAPAALLALLLMKSHFPMVMLLASKYNAPPFSAALSLNLEPVTFKFAKSLDSFI